MAGKLLPDDLWDKIAGRFPEYESSPHGGRPPASDRDALTVILFVLKTGIGWKDVPQELGSTELRQLSSVLICRGTEDQWYDADIFATDVRRLKEAGLPVQAQVVAGGHEWSGEVNDAAGRFLGEQALTAAHD